MPSRKKRSDWLQIGSGKGYFHRVHYPLQCLIFIAPLLVVYQIGAIIHPWTEQEAPNHVIAFVLMLRFFHLFGAVGSWLPLASVIAILLCWHLARKDAWKFEPSLYAGMAAESIALAIPVFVIGMAVQQRMVRADAAWTAAAAGGPMPWQTAAVISIGAGIYEELLFRLIAITVLNMILIDVFELKLAQAIPIIVLVSALLFALYHRLGDTPLTLGYFFFLMAFGVYCAGVFIYRGFGIVVGCHAVYDLIVVGAMYYRGH